MVKGNSEFEIRNSKLKIKTEFEESGFLDVQYVKSTAKLRSVWGCIKNGCVIGAMMFVAGCGLDLLGPAGIAMSNDLDTRLKERNNFTLLDDSELNWRTALSELGDEYKFLVVSDIHINDGKTNGFEKMRTVVEEGGFEFMVVLGDITQWSAREDLELFLDTAKSFGIPVYPLVGNHDIYFGNWDNWKELIGSTSYRIDAGSTTMFMMDNANLYFGKQQLDWLERELKGTQKRVFVFTHVHFFMKSPMGAQPHDANERARLASILRGKCDAVFSGHKHVGTEVNEAGGVKYITIDSFDHEGYYYIVSVNGDEVTYSSGTL